MMDAKGIKDRVAGISPERRELLERLAQKRGMQVPVEKAVASGHADMAGILQEVAVGREQYNDYSVNHDKSMIQSVYNAYHRQMHGAVFDEESVFMNLGYVATDAPQYSPVRLPEHMLGRKYIKLVLEVFGDCDLNGRRLLDVGCGRGGTIRTALTYCKPSLAIGVDLTTGGIELARRSLRFPNTWFLRGNAEHLPFADAAFDVVTNVESSHHYSNVDSFYRNVWRVLAPGGHFLYTTFLPVPQFEHDLVTLAELGFQLKRELDITPNVLAACDQDRGGVFSGFASGEENPWIANAVSMPGSDTYNYMSSGRALYKLFKFVKPA